MSDAEIQLIPTRTHGRVLIRGARAGAARGVLVGFHGYMESAAIQMERLAAIPGASTWTLLSVQALHRFYRGRTTEVVASWMTRQDREAAIADNIEYIGNALEAVPHDAATRIVYAGFSQGVPMAFRAALAGRHLAAGVIAVGGDVPPELLEDAGLRFPPVLMARGERDDWFTQARFDADVTALARRGVSVQTLVFDGTHEWNDAVATAAARLLASL